MTSRKSLAGSAPQCVAAVDAVLGEGPLWDPRANRLLFLDIKGEKVFRYDPEGDAIETLSINAMVSALGLARSGGYVCSFRNGFSFLDVDAGDVKLSPISDPERDQPQNRFNDGKVDPFGCFWAGTMDDSEQAATGVLWRLAPDGSVALIAEGLGVANGPAFDETRGRVYFTDSARRTIYMARFDENDVGENHVFRKFDRADGYPDGMEVDGEGCLWVAFWDGYAVRRYSPDGDLLEEISLPVPRPTSLLIVGDALYVTTARFGLDEAMLAKYPLSGGLFSVRLGKPLAPIPPRFFDDRSLRRE